MYSCSLISVISLVELNIFITRTANYSVYTVYAASDMTGRRSYVKLYLLRMFHVYKAYTFQIFNFISRTLQLDSSGIHSRHIVLLRMSK